MREVPLSRGLVAVATCLLLGVSLDAQQLPRWVSKLSLHGYISQAYAISDDHPIFGIPTNGTTDYRDLALQFRFDQDKQNTFVVQLRHERLGETAKSNQDDVQLDWAFYQRNITDRLSVKAGRIPLPLGIFNEARGAGITFPFNKPPYEFYQNNYTSKTLEGVLASTSLPGPRGWSFDVDAYGGQWKLDQWGSSDRNDARDAYGGQVWINTPWAGKRIGAGAYRCTVERGSGNFVDYLMLHGSIDADFDRVLVASEYLSGNLGAGRYRAGYGQLGYQLTPRFSVHTRAAVARLTFPRNGHSSKSKLSKDVGLAFNFAIQPTLLLKLEGHTNEGVLREDAPLNLFGPPVKTRYVIGTVVATF